MRNSIGNNQTNVRRSKKYRVIVFWSAVIFLIVLALLRTAGGLIVVDQSTYYRVGSSVYTSPVALDLDILATYENRDIVGLVEFNHAGAPFEPRLVVEVEADSPYHFVQFEQIIVTYPEGKQSSFDADVRYDLKNADSLVSPTSHRSGDKPEHDKEFYRLRQPVHVDLQLSPEKNTTCRVMVKGILLDAEENETPFSVSAEFKRLQIFHIGLKFVAQMSV